MIELQIKPLSVNDAWQGKRFKTPKYSKYERDVLFLLPKLDMPKPPYQVYLSFAFSSKLSDIDNPVKPFLDILQKKYSINDKDIESLMIYKQKVKKGFESIKFYIKTYNRYEDFTKLV